MASQRKKRFLSVTNIPERASSPPEPATHDQQRHGDELAFAETASRPSLLHLTLSSSSAALDPAEVAILMANESKERRKKEETRLELEKIQERIQYTLAEYQPEAPSQRAETPSAKDVDLLAVRSPEELYKLLGDVRLRSKYHQHVTVLLLGHEAALEDRERLLQSIHEFFQETTAGNTEQLLQEISSGEINLEEATEGLESALRTAQTAGERLLEIKKDMGQLFAIVQAFPDTKKGRKKMEKALLKAQEEVESLQNQLSSLRGEMEGSREKVTRLQKQVDTKAAECDKLKKTVGEVEQLKRTNLGLQSELAAMKEAVEKVKRELERERQEKLQIMASKTEVKEVVKEIERAEDSGRVTELEAALVSEKKMVEDLEAKIAEKEGEFQEKMAAVVAEHEAEVQEMRCRYEEQMKSLIEDDMFSDIPSPAEQEEEEFADERGGEEAVDDDGLEKDEETSGDVSAAVERLKQEHREREMKMKDELNEMKNKSRKTITALKAQLVEAQNKLTDEKSSLQKEIDGLQAEKVSAEADRESKNEEIASLEEARLTLQAQLAELTARESEREALVVQLQKELQEARLGGARPPKAFQLGDLVNRSAQWSEHSPVTDRTPSHRPTSPQFPILPMDEVLFSCEPSAAQLNHLPYDNGATPQSIQSHLAGGHTPYSEGSQIPGGTQFFHGSLDQSGSIQNLDDSIAGNNTITTTAPPPHALQMLGQSRLSHYSTQQARGGSLSPDHPVVAEWLKTYDLVMKFRDGVADILREDERFESEVDDLCSIEGVPFEREEEVHGQVTQMRFSLTLMLHQMEGTLQDAFSKLLRGGETREDSSARNEEEGEQVRELRLAKARLKKQLKQSEDTHKMELQDSKETIANLSNKVETLRMEVASLRHNMVANERGIPTNGPLSMFTNLDFDHNTQELKSAVESERITAEAYQRVREEMSAYLSVPTQRLAHLGRRKRQKQLTEQLVCEVRREMRDRESKAEVVVERIRSHDQLRQREFELEMAGLREKRVTLAHQLTLKLGEMEGLTKSLLIKPIFGASFQSRDQSLITPLPRPIPIRRAQSGYSHKLHDRPGSGTVGSGGQTSRENDLKTSQHLPETVGKEKKSGRLGQIADSPASPHTTSPRTVRKWEGLASHRATPLPPPHLHTHSLLSRANRTPQRERGEKRDERSAWTMEESRPSTRQSRLPFSPLMFHAPPTIPCIMELDSSRKRYLVGLLGQLGLTAPVTPQPLTTERSSEPQSRLVAHTTQGKPQTTSRPHTRSLSCPRNPSLPPINIPSRINGPLAPAIY